MFFILFWQNNIYYCSSAFRTVGGPGILHGEGCRFINFKNYCYDKVTFTSGRVGR